MLANHLLYTAFSLSWKGAKIALWLILIGYTSAGEQLPTFAQVQPDTTLSAPSVVNTVGTTQEITGGTMRGNQLFHSFKAFSIPTGTIAYFNQPSSIETIFARITGNSVSTIDGLMRANGTANLFLINPNGILFGANAQLEIGGSFLATTGDRILFADNTFYSASNPQPPLLTISAPVGVQFGAQAQLITMQSTGFQVAAGKTLALIGGAITVQGGALFAPAGQIELGSVAPGSQVLVSPTRSELAVQYAGATGFQDIQISQISTIDTSGNGGGSIQIQGRQVSVLEGSTLYAINYGTELGRGITLRASERLDLSGTDPDYGYINSSAYAGTRSSGRGGDVLVETPYLRLSGGGQLGTGAFGTGDSGNVTIHANTIEAIGGAAPYFIFPSGIYTTAQSQATGRGGNLTILAQRLRLSDGAEVSTATKGRGTAGNLTVQAREIDLSGSLGNAEFPDIAPTFLITEVTRGASGQGGNLNLTVDRLSLQAGALISARTFGSGNAGTLSIQATDTIDVAGTSPYSRIMSSILAGVESGASGNGNTLSIAARYLNLIDGGQISTSTFGTGSAGKIDILARSLSLSGTTPDGHSSRIAATTSTSGNGGEVSIRAKTLTLQNQAQITVSSSASGNAGNLNISANSLRLSDHSSLRAETNAGDQGNIRIDADTIGLNRNSLISANAQGTATGGNITLNAIALIARGNSDITANSVSSFGGSIWVNVKSILGAEVRPALSPESDITASSQRGAAFNGTVKIAGLSVDPRQGLTEMTTTLIDPNLQVTAACNLTAGNSFVATGRGGIPANPQTYYAPHAWADLREVVNVSRSARVTVERDDPASKQIEATHWVKTASGEIQLLAEPNQPRSPAFSCLSHQ